MKLFLLCLLLHCLLPLGAQQRCSPYNPPPAKAPLLVPAPFLPNASAPEVTGAGEKGAKETVLIPVVVHVLYHSESLNISDAQIRSGIEALNRDFRRRNADSVQAPLHFRAMAADMELEFALATSDPSGQATTGIIRQQTSVTDWVNDDKIKFSAKGGSDAWDRNSYLNIWIGNMPRSLGYASSPGCQPALDGIVINTAVFGTLGKTGAYNMGRTLVHEAGHWLGLKHIWGDSDCGDDGIADTPPQAGFTSGCPATPISTCSNGALGDMFMNYMDFTNDACMNLFTQGQKEKVWSCLVKGGVRFSLLSSKGLHQPWNWTAKPEESKETAGQDVSAHPVRIYPNPVGQTLHITLSPEFTSGAVQVYSINGNREMQSFIKGNTTVLNVSRLKPGFYVLHISNGQKTNRMHFVKSASSN